MKAFYPINYLINQIVFDKNCSQEEIDILLERVYVIDKNIIIYHEFPNLTPYSVHLVMDKIASITQNLPNFYLIVDLTEANRPSYEIEKVLTEKFSPLNDASIKTCFFTGKNILVTVALKFLLNKFKNLRCEVYVSKEEAINACKTN